MPSKKLFQIKASDEDLKGRYSNVLQISHGKEEFVLDYMLIHLPSPQFISRIIVSPGHIKRMIKALQDNLDKFEDKFGKVEELDEPKMGFKPKN